MKAYNITLEKITSKGTTLKLEVLELEFMLGIMSLQSHRTHNYTIWKFSHYSLREKKSFQCSPCREVQYIYEFTKYE
jgi:hypothetical protein